MAYINKIELSDLLPALYEISKKLIGSEKATVLDAIDKLKTQEQEIRKAYLSGQERMREQIASFIEPDNQPCDCASLIKTSDGPRWSHTCDCRNSGDTTEVSMWCCSMNDAIRIRSLPLQSNDEKELGRCAC